VVKLSPFCIVQLPALQRFDVKPQRRDRRFQFVRDRIQKTVVLFVATDFAHKENRVNDHAGRDESEENYSENERYHFAPVDHNPTDVSARW